MHADPRGLPQHSGHQRALRDAVEMPGQFMENFVWRPEVLPLISAHIDSGEPLPVDLLQPRRHAHFNAAPDTLRQIELATLISTTRTRPQGGCQVAATLAEVRRRVAIVPPAPFTACPRAVYLRRNTPRATTATNGPSACRRCVQAFRCQNIDSTTAALPRFHSFARGQRRCDGCVCAISRPPAMCGAVSKQNRSVRSAALLFALLAAGAAADTPMSATNWCSACTPKQNGQGSVGHPALRHKRGDRASGSSPGTPERRHVRLGSNRHSTQQSLPSCGSSSSKKN